MFHNFLEACPSFVLLMLYKQSKPSFTHQSFFFGGEGGLHLRHGQFLGLVSNLGCSCWLWPQPQQGRIQATSVTCATACSNARSLTHWVRPGTHILMDSSRVLNLLSHSRNSYPLVLHSGFSIFWFCLFVCLFVFRATPAAYGASQARGLIGATAAGLQHRIWAATVAYTTAHSNARSLTHWLRPGIKLATSSFLVRSFSTAPHRELLFSVFC